MKKRRVTTQQESKPAGQQPRRVRLPGFLIGDEVGLGDAVKRITYALGIKTCGGCERRAQTLNQWIRFSR